MRPAIFGHGTPLHNGITMHLTPFPTRYVSCRIHKRLGAPLAQNGRGKTGEEELGACNLAVMTREANPITPDELDLLTKVS